MTPGDGGGAVGEQAPVVPWRRFERERHARKAAEALLVAKSAELFDALQASRETERRLQLALWGSGETVWEWHAPDGVLRMTGGTLEHPGWIVPAQPLWQWFRLVHPDDQANVGLLCRLHASGTRPEIDIACRLRTAAGWRWIRVRGRTLERDAAGRPRSVYGTAKDVTDQRDAEHAFHLLAEAFASTLDAVVVVDAHWAVVQANESFRTLSGLPDAASGANLAHQVELPTLVLQGGQAWVGETWLRTTLGDRIPVEASVTVVPERAGQGRCQIVVLRDIRDRHAQAQALRRMALEDALTGLPNRSALERALETRLTAQQPFTLFFLDLDGFKGVNDAFGHSAGDQLLQEIGRRLAAALPHGFLTSSPP